MIEIRNGQIGDLPGIVGIYNHYVRETPITFDIDETTVEARAAWFEQFSEAGRHQVLVCLEDGKLTGYAHANPFRPKAAYAESVETTIYMASDRHGRGAGTALLGTLLARVTDAGVHRAYAIITTPNPASIRLHENLGYEALMVLSEVGRKFDRFWDTQWMEKRF